MVKATHEPRDTQLPYSPNVEFFGAPDIGTAEPSGFRDAFNQASQGIYPAQAIERIGADGYDPVILGYDHGNPNELPAILGKLDELRATSDKPLRVLQEIDPQQLQWIKDFLEMERGFKARGTIGGKSVRADEAQRLEDYRVRLRAKHGEGLSLWCLDNGVTVDSIEHPQVRQWIDQDTARYSDEEEAWLFAGRTPREFYTAIRRDAYGLGLIEAEKPDIISVGYLHALKYDVLLDRDGRRTFYYLNTPLRWDEILRHWISAHRDYAHTQPAQGS